MMICSIAELWGAQAGSLQFAAACRKHLRRERVTATVPSGKLPDGAGWQPALPRIRVRHSPA